MIHTVHIYIYICIHIHNIFTIYGGSRESHIEIHRIMCKITVTPAWFLGDVCKHHEVLNTDRKAHGYLAQRVPSLLDASSSTH